MELIDENEKRAAKRKAYYRSWREKKKKKEQELVDRVIQRCKAAGNGVHLGVLDAISILDVFKSKTKVTKTEIALYLDKFQTLVISAEEAAKVIVLSHS